jgi:GNAT superfamily N-acetyltransferase
MQTRKITKADFDQIVEVIDRWWGGPISTFAHPIFFYELGDNALVVEHEGRLIGFLLGFISFKEPKTGYVHLVGIHPDYRRQGVGRVLYETFTEHCQRAGCLRMKAITTSGYEGSIRFHEAMGWAAEEVEDYAGPSRKRVVFTKALVPANVGLA